MIATFPLTSSQKVDCAAHRPALPSGHPFADVQDIYWSSTTSLFELDWAWALYLEKGATVVWTVESLLSVAPDV